MAFLGRNSVVQVYDGATYVTVATVVSINGPSAQVGTVDSTHLTSTAKEFLPSLPDWGEVSFTGEYDPTAASHTELTDLVASPTVRGWKLILGDEDSTTFAFNGLLTGWNLSGIENEGMVVFEATVKVSGAVTIS